MAKRPSLTNASYWTKTEAELRFIVKDATEAARCCAEWSDPAAESKYADQINDACTVLWHRNPGVSTGKARG
jgi:hypothetical protein